LFCKKTELVTLNPPPPSSMAAANQNQLNSIRKQSAKQIATLLDTWGQRRLLSLSCLKPLHSLR